MRKYCASLKKKVACTSSASNRWNCTSRCWQKSFRPWIKRPINSLSKMRNLRKRMTSSKSRWSRHRMSQLPFSRSWWLCSIKWHSKRKRPKRSRPTWRRKIMSCINTSQCLNKSSLKRPEMIQRIFKDQQYLSQSQRRMISGPRAAASACKGQSTSVPIATESSMQVSVQTAARPPRKLNHCRYLLQKARSR